MKLLKRLAAGGMAMACALALAAPPLSWAEDGFTEMRPSSGGEEPLYQEAPKPRPVKSYSDDSPPAYSPSPKVKKVKKSKKAKTVKTAAAPQKVKKSKKGKKSAPATVTKKAKKSKKSKKAKKADAPKSKKVKKSKKTKRSSAN